MAAATASCWEAAREVEFREHGHSYALSLSFLEQIDSGLRILSWISGRYGGGYGRDTGKALIIN